MIIVRIVGGLSSQLHKYAVGRALALRLGTELKLDLDWFDNPPTTDTPVALSARKILLVRGRGPTTGSSACAWSLLVEPCGSA